MRGREGGWPRRTRACPASNLCGHLVERRLLEPDGADHLAAEVEGAHRVEQLPAAPERPDPGRPADLVAGDRDEVGAERLDVDRAVRCCLRRVDDHDRPLLVRPRRELGDGVDRPERVRDEVVRDDLHVPLACETLERVELELALVVDRDVAEARAGAGRDVLPRDEVRVVLQLGDDDEVAGAEVVEAPGVRDEVERLGRVPGEDDLLLARRVEERGDRAARGLERPRSPAPRAGRRPGGRSRTRARRTRASGRAPGAASGPRRRSRGTRRACRRRAPRRPGKSARRRCASRTGAEVVLTRSIVATGSGPPGAGGASTASGAFRVCPAEGGDRRRIRLRRILLATTHCVCTWPFVEARSAISRWRSTAAATV